LGLAFHPGYEQNGRFFVHYSAKGSHDSTVMEFKRSAGDPLKADAAPVQLVLQHTTAQYNHNGGSTEFGPDGYLYIGLGDGGNQNDPECDAQNPANLLGKISRLDVDAAPSATGYPAAPGNPNGARQFHIGFRNPWRTSFDVCTGDYYIGDVGQNTYEEVDVAPAASPPVAKNFGWPFREGKHDHANTCPPDPGPWTEPVAEYDHGQGCSVTGGYVYRGSKIPWLRGTYFYGDYCSARVWMIHWASGSVDAPALVPGVSQQVGNVSSFGQDGRGEVYVVNYGGSVHRIDPG
jgi:glucose/arabinose dehydrogenase